MKHPSLVYLVLCLWCWAPLAQLRAIPLAQFLSGSPPSATSYLVDENCEGTGTPSGWTNTGAIDWDSTTNPPQGFQSVTYGGAGTFQSAYIAFTPQTTVYAYCLLRRISASSATNASVFSLRSEDGTTGRASMGQNYSSPNTQFKIATDGTWGSASSVVQHESTNATVWHVWIKYVASGTCELAMSTSGTKPSSDGSGNVYLTKADASGGTAGRIYIYPRGADGGWRMDRILVSTSPIGDNP